MLRQTVRGGFNGPGAIEEMIRKVAHISNQLLVRRKAAGGSCLYINCIPCIKQLGTRRLDVKTDWLRGLRVLIPSLPCMKASQ